MKIGILLEGSPKMGGGFFQSLKSTLILFDIKKYNSYFELIVTDTETKKYLPKLNSKIKLYKKNFITNYLIQFFEIDLIRDFLNKIKINHPFNNFIKKNNYDLIIFLAPSPMSRYCREISFISNIWDTDHKKNSQFPEHNSNFTFENREKLYKEIIFRAFKIIVSHKSNKIDLINFYNSSEKNIIIQNFIPILPSFFMNKNNENYFSKLSDGFHLPKNKKIIFYPAQFWPHKNHKYIIDTAEILKKNNDDRFYFVFCGGNKGTYDYLKKIIAQKNLNNYFKMLTFLSDDEVISLYLKCNAVVMPTLGGPTNLPIYESFFFKKIIFYTKDLIINDKINDHLININTLSPKDFVNKLEICFNDSKIKEITDKNYEYYFEVCNENSFKENYTMIIDEFSELLKRWK